MIVASFGPHSAIPGHDQETARALNIYAKLGVGDRAAAVAEAFNRGLLTPEPRDNPDRR
jgi:hypothetical protein